VPVTENEELLFVLWQLAQCCDKQVKLEKLIENPEGDRVRIVEGKDLGPVELQKKIDDVSVLS